MRGNRGYLGLPTRFKEEVRLKEFAGGELANEFFVGVEEVEGGKFRAFDPSDFAKNAVLQLVLVALDQVEVQVDGVTVLVGVQNAGDFAANFRLDRQLFVEFATQCLRRGFTGFDFAAGKFPFEREGLVLGALATQDLIAAKDHSGHHLLGQDGRLDFSSAARW